MKRILSCILLAGLIVVLSSWGRTGHSTIGLIAERHLSAAASTSVSALLGRESLADVASWADEQRSRSTASWHFINVPLGLSFADFKQQVESKEDVYVALVKEEAILADGAAAREDRVNALKYIVHFVGDIHQPMHVSRAEDKGGNTIQVRYNGQGTNLHSLWDTKLLEHGGLNAEQLAKQLDVATPQQVNKWQHNPQMIWAWESYHISTQLYEEISKNDSEIDDAYYRAHLPIVQTQVEKAGIRLAGILNAIFAKTTITATGIAPMIMSSADAVIVSENDIATHVGEVVKVCSRVYGHKDFGSMVLLNMGAAYPNSIFTVVLRGDARSLVESLGGKSICVSGKVVDYKGKPEIVVNDKAQIAE